MGKQIKKEGNVLLMQEAKKLLKTYMRKYLLFALFILLVELLILLLMNLSTKTMGQYVGTSIIVINVIAALIVASFFDYSPAKQLRKNNFVLSETKMTKNQGIVFCNFLNIRLKIKLLINIIITLIIVLVTICVYVI